MLKDSKSKICLFPAQESPAVLADLNGKRIKKRQSKSRQGLRSGDLCPGCKHGRLGYDGCLNLSCPECGFTSGGGFT